MSRDLSTLVLAPVLLLAPAPLRLPRTIAGQPVHDGDELLAGPWSERRRGYHDRVVLVQHVVDATLPDGRPGALVVAWTPSDTRTTPSPVLAALLPALVAQGLVVAAWAVTDLDGALVVPALDGDPTPAGAAARDAWPADWRLHTDDDDSGDLMADPPRPPAAPTGPRCLAVVAS